ncbi:MAG: hypothetical protein NXH70_02480 [Hyphomonas sp.]|nr:hypothetical protein [Hyphomonas sp.]
MRKRQFTAEQATLAIEKTAKLLAQESVRVTTRGARAFIEWLPSGEIRRINLPMVPRDADQEFLDALQGFLDHEVGHALHTEPLKGRARENEFIKESGVHPQVMRGMANIVEDVRIEASMEKQFAGSKRNLEAVRKFFVERMQKPSLEGIDPSPAGDDERRAYILPVYFRARGGQTACEHFMDDMELWKYVEAYDKLFPDLPARLKALGSTLDAVELAIEIIEKTCETTPPDSDEADQEQEDDEDGADPDQDQQDPQDGDDGEDEQGNDPGEQSEADESDQSQDEEDGDQQDEGDEGDDDDGQGDSDGEDDSDDDDDQGSGQSDDEGDDDGSEDETEPSDDGGSGEDESDDDATEDEGGESDSDEGDDSDEDATSDSDAADGDEEPSDDDTQDADDADSDDGEPEDGSESSDGGDDGDDINSDDGSDEEMSDDPNAEGEESDTEPTGKIIVAVDYEALKDFDDAAAEELEKMVGKMDTDDPYHVFSRDLDVIEHATAYETAPVGDYEKSVEQTTGVLRKELQRLIAARSMSHMVPGKRSGRLHTSSLHRLRVGDDRVFARKHEVQSKNTAVSLVVDCSGSMRGSKIKTAMEAAWAFADTLTRLNVKNEVIGFTTLRAYYDSKPSGTYNPSEVQRYASTMGVSLSSVRFLPLHMPVFKDFNENFGIDQKRRMAGFATRGQMLENVDGECIRIAGHRLSQQRADRHVMIVFSDGWPSGGCAERLLERDLRSAVNELEAAKIETIGVGIQSDAVRQFYPKSFVIQKSEELAGATIRELKEILTR